MLDTRSDEKFEWRKQTRAFKVDRPGRYERYRLEASGTLAEIELLNHDEAVPLGTEVGGSATWPGSTVPVRVDVWNSGGSSLGGDVALAVPDGWSVSPATRSFGPLATGGSQTLTFDVTVPAGVEPGEYDVDATATAGSVEAHGTGTVQVLGDTIEFSPGTSAEEPWLSEDGGSQLDGPAFDGSGRFTDNERFFVYKFELPADVTGGTLSVNIGNEFHVRGVHRRVELEDGAARGPGDPRPVEPRVARPRPERAARGRPDRVPAVLRLVHLRRLGRVARADEGGAAAERLTLRCRPPCATRAAPSGCAPPCSRSR